MLKLQSIGAFLKKPEVILLLILAIFFLKGVFLVTVFPIFTGQDEARHYNTVQFLAEPKNRTWPITQRGKFDNPTFDQYNFSEEIRNTGMAAEFDTARHISYGTVPFDLGYDGKNETQINSNHWQSINNFYPPDIAEKSLYHILASYIERIFSGSNILVRFFLERIFSAFLGTLAVLFTYFIARTIGIKEKESLIITAIVAFQPKFSMYSTNINYDALLIPLFFLFTLGAVLSLKNGLNWKNAGAMLVAIILGLFTKPTAIVMVPVFLALIAFHAYNYTKNKKKALKNLLIFLVFAMIMLLALNMKYNLYGLIPHKGSLGEIFSSLQDYLNKSLSMGRFGLSARTYWGDLTWGDSWLGGNITMMIWIVQCFSVVGLVYYLFSKKKFDYLPEKKYVIFLIGMIVALQLGIRFADWKVFTLYDNLSLGTPGRYFLPNLAAHIILVFVGLSALLRKEKYFNYSLIAGMLLMFAFSMYIIFDLVVPRTYL